MTCLIQSILKVANKLYSSTPLNLTDNVAKSNYQLLINLMSNLKANDVDFNQLEIDRTVLSRAPCAYIRLFENQFFNLSIFSIRPGSRLPLHNHPGMNGFLKVLFGKIMIKNFDPLPLDVDQPPKSILNLIPYHLKANPIIPALQLEDNVISCDDQRIALVEPDKGRFYLKMNCSCISVINSSSVLSTGNIHEITVASDCKTGSAFLDLITPPYSNELSERSVSYYEVIGKSYSEKLANDITWLVEIDTPHDYWCDYAFYNGPELSHRILEEE